MANTIPELLQIIMWELIKNLPVDTDYRQSERNILRCPFSILAGVVRLELTARGFGDLYTKPSKFSYNADFEGFEFLCIPICILIAL